MQTSSTTDSGRIYAVDAFRVISIFAVIVIHTIPFESNITTIGQQFDMATVANQLARFAVPFFFIISGYFWAKKIKKYDSLSQPTLSTVKRMLFLFFAWSLVYLIPWDLSFSFKDGLGNFIREIYWNLLAVSRDIPTLLMRGTESHLWFLMSLVCCLGISTLFVHLKRIKVLSFLALLFYLLAILGKPYSETPIGFHSEFNLRYGPFFALIYFVTGIGLANKSYKGNWLILGVLLLVIGLIMHFAELYFLNRIWGVSMLQDYVFGTYFFGTGIALISLSNIKTPFFLRPNSVGQLVLGIYLSHFIFVDLLSPINLLYKGKLFWSFTYPLTVFFLSYFATLLLSKNTVSKHFVS